MSIIGQYRRQGQQSGESQRVNRHKPSAYQRLLCRPPPAAPRSALGRASLMVKVLPSRSVPFKAAMALSPSALSLISTNPKPLACPVSRSGDEADTIYIAMYCKHGPNRLFGRTETEVPYEYIFHLCFLSGVKEH
jgi:hypothetical protein